MKKIFIILASIFLFFSFFGQASAEEKKNIYFFYSKYCPHCHEEEKFLDKILPKYQNISLQKFEIAENKKNADLLELVGQNLDFRIPGVPITVIGDKHVVGYLNELITGKELEKLIRDYSLDDNCPDVVWPIINPDLHKYATQETIVCKTSKSSKVSPDILLKKIKIPFVGERAVGDISLLSLSVIVGALDGFNPCAMWVLIFLISLLLGTRSRKKIIILGGIFIFAEALMYFLFLTAWFNAFMLIGYVKIIRLVIAGLALASAFYNLREYYRFKSVSCKVISNEKKNRIISRMKSLLDEKNMIIAVAGIFILAAAVNVVELACSAGLPAIYTQVLSFSILSPLQYYGYILIYMAFYMLDDLVIFIIAFITLKMAFFSGKYTRYSHLIGGILMLIIGLLLIFKPAWLMFR